jgi:hypothetical protein
MSTTITPNMTTEQLLKRIAEMEAANAKLQQEKADAEKRASEQGTFGIKIGRNGTVSVTGFGRYGVSLYTSQWEQLMPLVPAIGRFIKAYDKHIQARVDSPVADDQPNPFKPLKLKADSQFTAPTE